MSTSKGDIRNQVMGRIIKVMVAADGRGEEMVSAARRTFPGTPEDVLIEAWVKVESQKTDAWWESIEKTIDGELIERAFGKCHGA